MSPENQQYFEAMEAMFASLGWQLLMSDVEGFKEAISSQWRTATPDGLRFAQGRYDGLDQIATYEKQIENLKATAMQSALDEDE